MAHVLHSWLPRCQTPLPPTFNWRRRRNIRSARRRRWSKSPGAPPPKEWRRRRALLSHHFPDQLYAYQHFTAWERALAGLTIAPPLDMGCWGGTTQLLGRNVPELGAERPRLGRTWGGSTRADRLRGGSTGIRFYKPSIVTLPVSLCVSEILPLMFSRRPERHFFPTPVTPPLVSPKFPNVSLGLGGTPFGYEERRCWANWPCN